MPVTKFQGALIEEQGIKFAVVLVQPHVITTFDKAEANRIIATFEGRVFGVPTVLTAPDPMTQLPRYYGRNDIVKFLANTRPDLFPWREYTVTD